MALRDDIKTNMKTIQEVEIERSQEESQRIQKIKDYAVRDFKAEIIKKSQEGVSNNLLKGTFDFGRLVNPYRCKDTVIGHQKRILFSKYTVWNYRVDMTTDEMIRFSAIQKYADDENITLSLEITPLLRELRQIEFDASSFPKITATAQGVHYGGGLNELEISNLRLLIHYSLVL